MNFNKEVALDKINDLLEEGLDHLHKVGEYVEDMFKGDGIAKRATEGLLQTKDKILSSERSITRHIQKHPIIFILAGVSLIGLLVAKQACNQRERTDW